MQTITTAELVLEPLTVAHAQAMFEVLADPEIYHYLDYPPPPSAEHLRTVYARVEARQSPDGQQTWLNWVVRPQGGPAPVGYVQATVVSTGDVASIGYVLSSRHWGHGYAYGAVQAMLEHLPMAYGVRRFLATVEVENRRSIRLLERLAFRPATESEIAGHELSATERLFVR